MNDFDAQLPPEIPFPEVLSALQDPEEPLAPRFLYRLSDLEADELQVLGEAWGQIPTWRRKALLEDLEQLFGDDYLLSFEGICRLGIKDSHPEIRFLSVRSLWDYEVADLIPDYWRLMEQDEDEEVRACAATALGKYVYQGELEELPEKRHRENEARLLRVVQGEDTPLVRRKALESLGYSMHQEIPGLIEKAFDTQETEWMESAVFAMGRSCDKRWSEQVITTLDHVQPSLRMEAARAAGELEIQETGPRLLEMIDDHTDVRSAAIWSLSQIGGQGVQEIFGKLIEASEDDEEITFIENALDNLIFNQSIDMFDMIELDEDQVFADDFIDDDDLDSDYDSMIGNLGTEDDDEDDEAAY